MNSNERRARRRARREQRRKIKRQETLASIGTAEDVFCYHDMFRCGEECCKNVMWKQSVQNFHRHLFSRTAVNRKHVLNNYKPKPLSRFTINERGKTRHIEAPHIDDRQIQKVITRKVLLPLYQPQLIHDNGASLRGKGLLFSQRQLDKALKQHEKLYGRTGWIIMADFKGFFPNADRNIVKQRHQEIPDWKLYQILDTVVDLGAGNKGLPLGVETSQIEMLSLPSPLDNYMTCQVGLSGYGHYMDDYHILVPPHEDPQKVLNMFQKKALESGMIVHNKKTQIFKFGEAFKFCKRKRIWKDNCIIQRGCSKSVQRTRRKIKMFSKVVGKKITYEDVYTSIQSSLAYFKETNSHKIVLRLRRLFYASFGFSCDDLLEFRRRDMEIHHVNNNTTRFQLSNQVS